VQQFRASNARRMGDGPGSDAAPRRFGRQSEFLNHFSHNHLQHILVVTLELVHGLLRGRRSTLGERTNQTDRLALAMGEVDGRAGWFFSKSLAIKHF